VSELLDAAANDGESENGDALTVEGSGQNGRKLQALKEVTTHAKKGFALVAQRTPTR